MRITVFAIFSALSVAMAAPAGAEGTGPSATTATYGAWTVRCAKAADKEDGETCEIVQSVTLRKTGQAIIQVAIGRLKADDPLSIVVQVPIGVSLRTEVGLKLGAPEVEDGASVTARYFRCTPQACLADVKPDDAWVDGLRGAEALTASFVDGNGRTIRIPVSLEGFSDAFAAVFPQ